jgi:di/tricarboxylate transporter
LRHAGQFSIAPPGMTGEQIFLSVLLAAIFALFLWGRWRYDVVAFAALLTAAAAGAVPADKVFAGFGHPATVTVAMVLIISRGLQNAGTVELIARRLLPPMKSTWAHVASLSGAAGVLSAFMNNVGALALLMPAAIQSAAKAKRAPAVLLMPLSFGSILGGLVTLIGTPTNIIVSAFRAEQVGAPYGMFDFTPVGIVVALAGVAFVALVGWRLIPSERRARRSSQELFQIESYVSEVVVPPGSAAIGKTIVELEELAGEHETVILGIVRNERRLYGVGRYETLREGDVLIVEAEPEGLDTVLKRLGLASLGSDKQKERGGPMADLALSEAVVQPRAFINGRTAGSLRLRRRYGVNLVGVSRQGSPYRGRLSAFQFQPGDVLLLEGEVELLTDVIATLGCLPLAERRLQLGRPNRALMSIGIFAGMILLAVFGVLQIPVALAIAAAGLVLLNIVPVREIYDSIDFSVIVLLGAMIPVGAALQDSGTTALFVKAATAPLAGFPPVVALGVLLVVTMTLSDVINNAATAVVMAPIGVQMAATLNANPDAFLMAVAIGASCAFLTPIGHQNNTLIMGPGGYRFGDYWRMGLPLEIIIVAVALPMILWIWPLQAAAG